MINYEIFCQIKNLKEQKQLTAAQIAAELSLDMRTVAKWMARDHFTPRKKTRQSSKLDPFKNDIVRMLDDHPYSATQIFQRIREQGFEGGYTIVKEYVRKVRPPKTKAYLILAFAPGECARWIGALMEPSTWDQHADDSAFLSWSFVTAA